ncbi:MAG: hypothetical protein ACLFQB_13075 [Chitinispirillaceae bacterium]
MRTAEVVLIMLAVLVTGVSASEMVKVKGGSAEVYSSSDKRFNNAVFTVSSDEVLTVTGEKRNYYEVLDSRGRSGWVEKSEVRNVKTSTSLVLDPVAVEGYLDQPNSAFIMDWSIDDPTGIRLERSFKSALRNNVDRETVERICN